MPTQWWPIKRSVLILTARLTAAGVLLVLTGCRAKTLPLAKLPVRTVLPNARPLAWLDERFLLTGFDNKIVKLDSRDSKIVQVVSEPFYPGVAYECFSRMGGRFAVTAPEKRSGSTSFANMVYRWVPDWDQPDRFEGLETLEFWNTNPHDCTAVDYKKPASIEEQSAAQLLRAADGRTKVYYRGSRVDGPHERSVAIERDGRAAEVWLETTPRYYGSAVQVRSSFDQASGNYLWYLATQDFNRDSRHWPLKAWWVAPEGEVTSIVILPHGPWIKPFSTLYNMRYFSCGPPCYSNMEMWAGNGQIYIAVWGKAIASAVRGVYRLEPGGQAWEKIIAGVLDNGLILSPGGRQVAYAVEGQLQIMTVCDSDNG